MALSKFYIFALSLLGLSFSGASFAGATPFPTAVSVRPFTLPQGMTEVAAKAQLAFPRDDFGNFASDEMFSLAWAQVGVGVTDDFQLGIGWGGFQIPNFNPAQFVVLNGGYFLFAGKYAAGMANLDVPIFFDSKGVVKNVVLSMPTAFGVTAHSSIMAFHDTFIDFGFANNNYSVAFNLPVRYSYQVNPNLWLGLGTNLAKFEVGTGNDHRYFWNSAPIHLQGLLAVTNAFDITGQIGFDDAFKAKDTFSFALGLAFRVGNLDG